MLHKENSLDYEPLRRRGSDLSKGEDSLKPTGPFSGFDERFEKGNQALPSKVAATDSGTPSSIKFALRGHSLSFLGILIFTFLVYFRPYELSPSLLWLSKGALITAIATLIIFVPTQLGLENKITIRPREVNLILMLLLLAFLSIPLATDKALAWDGFVEFFKVVVIFIVMVNVVRTSLRLKMLLWLVQIASLILCVFAIRAYLSRDLALGGTRIIGVLGNLFQNPNDLALHLVTFFPIVFALMLAARNPFSKLIYLATAILIICGIVVTFSRGGFLGLVAVAIALGWVLMRRNRFLVVIGSLVLVGLLLVAAPAYRERIATTNDASATARTGELKRSIYIALRHPLLGVGMNNFIVYSDTEHATHNAYTQVAAETGMPAAIIYVLFIVAAIKRLRKIPKPREVDKKLRMLPYLAIGLQAALIGYMVSSFFASVAYLWYLYYLVAYAISVGRLAEISRLQPQSKAVS